MRKFMLAALAMFLCPLAASADSGDEADPRPHPEPHAPRPRPQPAPLTPAPAPVPVPVTETPVAPAPTPEPGGINVILPPTEPVAAEGYEWFRLGASLGGEAGLVPMPAMSGLTGLEQPHLGLPVAALNVGAVIGFGGYNVSDPYLDVHGAFGVGTIASTAFSGGLTVGFVPVSGVILGLTGEGFTRDYGVSAGKYVSRSIGGRGGGTAIFDLHGQAPGALDVGLAVSLLIEGGSNRNAVTDQTVTGPGGTLMAALRVGGKH